MEPLSKKLAGENIAFSFPIEIKNANGNQTYYEDSGGFWCKREYDPKGRETYSEASNGDWHKREYDSEGNETYCEDSSGYWHKREYEGNKTSYCEDSSGYWRKSEYDSSGNETYYETSNGQKYGTPRAKHRGKVVTIDGIDYALKEINP